MSRRLSRVVAGVGMMVLPAGCVVPSHVGEAGPHGPQCAVIQAAAAIASTEERVAALQQIAGTPVLSEHEQEYLIDATLYGEEFSAGQADVFVILAGNPSMTQHTREYMADRLREANLASSDQRRVTEALAAAVMGDRPVRRAPVISLEPPPGVLPARGEAIPE